MDETFDRLFRFPDVVKASLFVRWLDVEGVSVRAWVGPFVRVRIGEGRRIRIEVWAKGYGGTPIGEWGEPVWRGIAMSTAESKTKTEWAYLVDKGGEGEWTVRKVDLSAPDQVVAEHRVLAGRCDCEGFGRSQDLRCRHTDMVLTNPTITDHKTARKAAAEVISMWGDRFDRLIFDDYVEFDPADGDVFAAPGEEAGVRAVRLMAKGEPIRSKGKEYRRVFCVRRKVQVIVDVS